MVITKTPFRMSFFGGGTDVEKYFRENGGAVISTTIDKYCYVTVRHLSPFFDYTTEVAYSRLERVTDISQIQHPAVRNAMGMLGMRELRITYEADLPARSGLGTSSAFAVGMLNAFHLMKGEQAGKKQLADEAIYLERRLCGEHGGWQDQVAAAFGGFNRIEFFGSGYDVRPINISDERKQELNGNLLLFHTGISRNSYEIQAETDMAGGAAKNAALKEMQKITDEAQGILEDEGKSLDGFGHLLGESWRLKKSTGPSISGDAIDGYYQKAMDAGAIGGKLLGAGGGGFLVFYVKHRKQEDVKDALNGLMCIPFSFEDGGAQAIYNAPETYTVGSREGGHAA